MANCELIVGPDAMTLDLGPNNCIHILYEHGDEWVHIIESMIKDMYEEDPYDDDIYDFKAIRDRMNIAIDNHFDSK